MKQRYLHSVYRSLHGRRGLTLQRHSPVCSTRDRLLLYEPLLSERVVYGTGDHLRSVAVCVDTICEEPRIRPVIIIASFEAPGPIGRASSTVHLEAWAEIHREYPRERTSRSVELQALDHCGDAMFHLETEHSIRSNEAIPG